MIQVIGWVLLLAYITFILFIFIGGGYITKILFNSNNQQLSSVGLSDKTELNIAKLTIILFWLVFIPLCILPIILGIKYYGKLLLF
jgi:amino acid transporter